LKLNKLIRESYLLFTHVKFILGLKLKNLGLFFKDSHNYFGARSSNPNGAGGGGGLAGKSDSQRLPKGSRKTLLECGPGRHHVFPHRSRPPHLHSGSVMHREISGERRSNVAAPQPENQMSRNELIPWSESVSGHTNVTAPTFLDCVVINGAHRN